MTNSPNARNALAISAIMNGLSFRRRKHRPFPFHRRRRHHHLRPHPQTRPRQRVPCRHHQNHLQRKPLSQQPLRLASGFVLLEVEGVNSHFICEGDFAGNPPNSKSTNATTRIFLDAKNISYLNAYKVADGPKKDVALCAPWWRNNTSDASLPASCRYGLYLSPKAAEGELATDDGKPPPALAKVPKPRLQRPERLRRRPRRLHETR